MSEEQREKAGITAAIDSTDWTRYAGPASAVRRRGQRRRHRLQAGAALGTTFAALGVALTVHGLDTNSVAQQGAAPASPNPTVASSERPGPPIPDPSRASASSQGSAPSSDYPSFPAHLPTTPLLVADPGKVLQSGVIGAGSVGSHTWQISYRVIPSASAANSQPQVIMVDISLDGKAVPISRGDGTQMGAAGYQAMDQYFRNSGITDPMVVAYGTPSPNAKAVDLRWKNGTVVKVPIYTVTGTRFAAFAWDPANPPEALEQVNADGVQQIKITHDSNGEWMDTATSQQMSAITPQSPPAVTTPTGAPNLSKTPQVTPISKGILGEGTVSGHSWQTAYEIIPSGSAQNASNEVFCTDTTVDGTTTQNGCGSAKPFGAAHFSFNYDTRGAGNSVLAMGYGGCDPGTTAVGLEWADGTKTAIAVQDVEGTPMAAEAFDPDNPPKYRLEYGSYGEYRIPLSGGITNSWSFDW